MRGSGGRGHIYLWLIHVDVWQKLTQNCKVIILQLKIKKNFKNRFLPSLHNLFNLLQFLLHNNILFLHSLSRTAPPMPLFKGNEVSALKTVFCSSFSSQLFSPTSQTNGAGVGFLHPARIPQGCFQTHANDARDRPQLRELCTLLPRLSLAPHQPHSPRLPVGSVLR